MPPATLRRAATVAALALGLAACSDAAGPSAPEATFTGRWAGRPWAARAHATLILGGTAGDTLYLGGSWPDGLVPVQSLRIRLAPFRGPGLYALGGDAVEMMDLVGGDAVSSTYVGARPLAGVVEIVRFAPEGLVEGTVSFRAVPGYGRGQYGTSPEFEDGRFQAGVRIFQWPPR
jgi:hypothetical protein